MAKKEDVDLYTNTIIKLMELKDSWFEIYIHNKKMAKEMDKATEDTMREEYYTKRKNMYDKLIKDIDDGKKDATMPIINWQDLE